MTLCNEHHQYDTGIFDSLTKTLFGISAGSGRGVSGSSSFIDNDAGQALVRSSSTEMMDDGMDLNESVDNVLTVAFLMFLTVLIAFLGAGLIALMLVILMHSNPHQEDDEEKQVREMRIEGEGVEDADEKL